MSSEPGGDEPRRALLWITLVALVLRLVHVLQIQGHELGAALIGDALRYDEWARYLLEESWFWREDTVYYQAPQFPYLLGVLYAVSGGSLLFAKLFQVLLGTATCSLLFAFTRRHFNARAAVACGLLAAASPVLIYFCGTLQKACLALFLCALFLFAVGRALGSVRVRDHVLLGFAAALLIQTRENAVLLFPVAAWFVYRGLRSTGAGRARIAKLAGVAVAVFALVLLPVALRNARVDANGDGRADGQFQVATSNAGPNLFIGNNPLANGRYVPLRPARGSWLYEQRDAIDLARTGLGLDREPTTEEVSGYWSGRAFEFLRTEPAAFGRLLFTKLRLVSHQVEVGDSESLYAHADHSGVLFVTQHVLGFGLVLALACASFLFATCRRTGRNLATGFALVYGASVVVFFVLDRYRSPLFVFLLPLAGFAIDRLLALRGGGAAAGLRRGIALWSGVALTLVLGAAAWIPIAGPFPRGEANAETPAFSYDLAGYKAGNYFNLGQIRAEPQRAGEATADAQARWRRAVAAFEEGLALNDVTLGRSGLGPMERSWKRPGLSFPSPTATCPGVHV